MIIWLYIYMVIYDIWWDMFFADSNSLAELPLNSTRDLSQNKLKPLRWLWQQDRPIGPLVDQRWPNNLVTSLVVTQKAWVCGFVQRCSEGLRKIDVESSSHLTGWYFALTSLQMSACTWWLIPLSKWVITPVISGLTLLIPFITGVN